MLLYYQTDSDNRICALCDTPLSGSLVFDFPEDLNRLIMQDYKFINNELVYDPLPVPTPPPTAQEQLDAQAAAIEELAKLISEVIV